MRRPLFGSNSRARAGSNPALSISPSRALRFFSSRWRGPGATVRFGRPFRFCPEIQPRRETLRQMTDEAMYILAAMLPEGRRGIYGDLSKATQETIEWL